MQSGAVGVDLALLNIWLRLLAFGAMYAREKKMRKVSPPSRTSPHRPLTRCDARSCPLVPGAYRIPWGLTRCKACLA